ncbi:Acyl carrier protein [subsurface metagenome]
MATVYERLKKIIVKLLRVKEEEITPSTNLVDLGADSLDLIALIMDIEDEFSNTSLKVDIPDEDAEKILTVQDAIDYLKDLGVKDD